jgi:hypothetical protein
MQGIPMMNLVFIRMGAKEKFFAVFVKHESIYFIFRKHVHAARVIDFTEQG